jgi:putative phage-type endonuclease
MLKRNHEVKMKILDLKQEGEEWHAFRRTHITGTDASTIMRLNPFKNRRQLFRLKMGLDDPEPMNEAMKRGKELEPIALNLLCKETGIDFKPAVVEYNDHSWIGASLDGLSSCFDYICEIKAMNEDGHELAIQGELRPYYSCQVQHCLMVTCAKKAFFCAYRPEHAQPLIILEIEPCIEMMAEMFEEERIFFEMMRNGIMPEDESFKFKLKVTNT